MDEQFLISILEKGSLTAGSLFLVWFIGKKYFAQIDTRLGEYKEQVDELKSRADRCDERHAKTESKQTDFQNKLIEIFKEIKK